VSIPKKNVASTHTLHMLNMHINWREFYPRLQSRVKRIYTDTAAENNMYVYQKKLLHLRILYAKYACQLAGVLSTSTVSC